MRTHAHRPRLDAESQRLLRDLTEVTSLPRGGPIPAWQSARLNARYHAALRLAEIVLRATSVEHQPGTVAQGSWWSRLHVRVLGQTL